MATTYQSVSIPIPDEEDDAGHVRQTKFQYRNSHNRLGHRHHWRENRIFRPAWRRWLMILVFLPAIALLLYQFSKIWKLYHETEMESVPITHIVQGVRERCLKLLPSVEIQSLDIPLEKSASPVKEIVYITGPGSSFPGETKTLLEQSFKWRFNWFTGYQTFYERDESFKVNETAVVHCGFYSEYGGFKVSDEDKSYMDACQVVVSTCIFGGGDDIYQPIGTSKETLRKVCYVAFWDKVTLKTQDLEGHYVDANHMVGKWRIIVVRGLPFVDQRLNGKIPKMLGHRLFPRARYSIWVDSKSQFRRDPLGVLEALLWRTISVLAISEHGAGSSIYDEALAVVKKNKATPEEVDMQINWYRMDGFPEDKKLNGHKALAEASIIVREHTPLTNVFMCLWFNEVVRFTSRDQLSFLYVLWRMGVLKEINMFPVCTHKDMVNAMSHKRKAKPVTVGDFQ